MNRRPITSIPHARRGVLAPIVALSLLVAMAGVALVFDRIWLDMARVELTTAAEGSALAAARALATDDLLRLQSDPQVRLTEARRVAGLVASRNLVAGRPVELNTAPGGDIQFGVFAAGADGIPQFLLTDLNPTTVRIWTERSRSRNNPVALFMQGVTGQPVGDVNGLGAATIDNHVTGIQPLPGSAAPLLPLAILRNDSAGERKDSWQVQIEQRKGRDRYGYDPETKQVTTGADGIPEMVLHSADVGQAAESTNVALLELRQGQAPDEFAAQLALGCTALDLVDFGGALSLAGTALPIAGRATIGSDSTDALNRLVGETRICLLYDQLQVSPQSGWGTAQCSGMVAGRILQITRQQGEVREIVLQPSVIATRTAQLGLSTAAANGATTGSAATGSADSTGISAATQNKYIYKLTLTE